jgi:amino acid permease
MAAGGGTGPVISTAVLGIFGLLSWYSHVSYARAADAALTDKDVESDSISSVWARVVPGGKATGWIADLGCVLLTAGCLLFYSTFVGDLLEPILSDIKDLPPILREKGPLTLLLHAVPILPLCLKRDLASLKGSSIVGLISIVSTLAFVLIRFVDGTYRPGGTFFEQMPNGLRSSKGASGILGHLADIAPLQASSKGIMTLVNMCCVAYACHYNAAKYYMQLDKRSLPQMKQAMKRGIGGSGIIFWVTMMIGFATFGLNTEANLLKNYHESSDVLATVARVATSVAMICGYPLIFSGLKSALFSLLRLDRPQVENRRQKQNIVTVLVLAALAAGASVVKQDDIAPVVGVLVSVFGSLVMYILPGILNNSVLSNKATKLRATPFFKNEKLFNALLVLMGIAFAVLGTQMSLQQS